MRSESQGLQIALIMFVILTLILGVTTFVFFKQYDEQREKTKKFEKQVADLDKQSRSLLEDLSLVKGWIGHAENSSMDQVRDGFDKDMASYGSTLPPGEQDYRSALEQLADVVVQKNDELAKIQTKFDQLRAEFNEREIRSQQQLAKMNEALEKAKQDNQVQTKTYNDSAAAIEQKSKATSAAQVQEQQRIQEERNKINAEKQDLERVAASTQAKVRELSTELSDYVPQKSDVADGQIRRVDQGKQTAWIDLGRADFVRVGLSFSVYPPNKSDFTNTNDLKGSVKVTRILGDHLAEVQLTSQDFNDPIFPNDKIYHPAFHPGRQERFAMSGLLDVDRDGRPDNHLIRQLIGLAGGIIDAEVKEDGTVEGKITPKTRILVEGRRPSDAGVQGSDTLKAVAAATTELRKKAEANGVRVMGIDEFLEHIGFSSVGRSYRPGDEYNLKQGTPRSSAGHNFTRRRPPSSVVPKTKAKSAY